MGEQDPFRPGSLDIVINYVNFTKPKPRETSKVIEIFSSHYVIQAGQCGLCGTLQCNSSSAAPCCRGWYSADKIPGSQKRPESTGSNDLGTCGSGPEFCECPNCLDSRVIGTDRSYSETRWMLRGIEKHLGLWYCRPKKKHA